MNAEWSNLNRKMQEQIKRKATNSEAINTLLVLRKELLHQILSFKSELNREDFNAMPFINAKGYHNKTIAYSLYHIFELKILWPKRSFKKVHRHFFRIIIVKE